MSTKLIDGVTVTLRGRDFVIPPMTFGQIKRNAADISRIQSGGEIGLDMLPVMATIIHGAMACNYPEMTIEQLEEDCLDLGNAREAMAAIMGVSGMVAAGQGNAKAVD